MIEETEYWQAVCQRNRQYDSRFVYAVRSTGVYCRPSCAARRPKRENVAFFSSPTRAEQAGFRACRRCHPDRDVAAEPHVALMREMCSFLAEPHEHLPTLAELALRFNLSPSHLQRTFKRIVGVTPHQYAAARRLERFKQGLKQGDTVTDALYEAGYASSSSLYEGVAEKLGMTPTTYQRGGAARITYAVTECALGWLLVATTECGLCAVRLGDSAADLEVGLAMEFPAATLVHEDDALRPGLTALLDYLRGAQPHLDLPLDVRATAFQWRVWDALREIPFGSTRSYREIATAIGQPTAARAVGRACARNPIALVIPCHRVIREDGDLGGYRWGIERKRRLLAQEASLAGPLIEGKPALPVADHPLAGSVAAAEAQ